MLPIHEIKISELCKISVNLFDSENANVIGETCCYHFKEIVNAAIATGNNLDTFLCKQILHGLSKHPIKTSLLFWYTPSNDLIFVTFTDKRMKASCNWLASIPGYYESGQQVLHLNARPFMHWNGHNLSRIYRLPSNYKANGFYASDFGASGGLIVGEVDESTYSRIESSQAKEWDYSIVPKRSEEVIEYKNSKNVLLHSYWTLAE